MTNPLLRPLRDRRNLPARARRLERLEHLFTDLPGLRLSTPQTARLLAVEQPAAERMLRELVGAGFLRVGDDGCFARASSGRRSRRSA